MKNEPKPPKRPEHWDGHSKKGQAWENSHFEFEQEMQELYDPSDPYGQYEFM